MRLRDQLASSLNFAKARDIELAWIDGQIDMSAGRTDTSAMSEGKGQESMDTKDNKEEGYNFAVKFFVRRLNTILICLPTLVYILFIINLFF